MPELKPCPFCGGEAIIKKNYNRFSEWWLVSCPKCHISQTGSEYEFSFEAIEAWNRRAEDGVEKCVNILHNAPTVDAIPVKDLERILSTTPGLELWDYQKRGIMSAVNRLCGKEKNDG